jgi:hypothetical protein
MYVNFLGSLWKKIKKQVQKLLRFNSLSAMITYLSLHKLVKIIHTMQRREALSTHWHNYYTIPHRRMTL